MTVSYEVRVRRPQAALWEFAATYHPHYFYGITYERRWKFFWKILFALLNGAEANTHARIDAIRAAKHHLSLGCQVKVIEHFDPRDTGAPSRIIWFNGRNIGYDDGPNHQAKARA